MTGQANFLGVYECTDFFVVVTANGQYASAGRPTLTTMLPTVKFVFVRKEMVGVSTGMWIASVAIAIQRHAAGT